MWRGVRDGTIRAENALKRLERSRHWVWTVSDPESTRLLVPEVGPRPLAMAQRVGHQVVSVFAPGCVPAWCSDGVKGYLPAILGHFGGWTHPARRQDKGPWPQPRWMPLPGLLYAPVVQQHRVVCGTREAMPPVLAAWGWKIHTAFVERLNLDLRQRVAAIGRRGNTLGQGEDGRRPQLTGSHAYDNCCLPHGSVRQPLVVPDPTHGRGSAKVWRPCTPAMAAGLTDHAWSLKEVLMCQHYSGQKIALVFKARS